jgi:hypothetical protein
MKTKSMDILCTPQTYIRHKTGINGNKRTFSAILPSW